MSMPALMSTDHEARPFNFLNPDWNSMIAVNIVGPWHAIDGKILFETDHGPLAITPIEDGARINLGSHDRADYGILAGPPQSVEAEVVERDGWTDIAWGNFHLAIRHRPMSFDFTRLDRRVLRSTSDGHFAREFRLPPFSRIGDDDNPAWIANFDLPSGEPVYGLGEKWGPLDKKGQLVHSVTHDALGVNAERSYKNCPFAWSPAGWGLFVHTPSQVHHAIGFAQWSHRTYGLYVGDEAVDLFLFAGDTPADILERYTRLTGRPVKPPLWSLGAILSKAYYKTADELLEAAREVRDKGMPCDIITLDGRAWQDTDKRFHFYLDPKRYPDPAGVIEQLKAMDLRLCVWEYPLVSFEGPYFEELSAKGWLLKDRRTGKPYRYRFDPSPFGAVLTQLPDSALIDFTHPDAYVWWRDRHKDLFDLGVDMIKSDFGEQVERDCLAYNGDSGDRLHNVYPLLYNRCVFEASEMYAPDGACLLARAGWSSSQRYPAQWGGDPQADWEGLAASLRGGLSWAMSGVACYATDIGGFYGDRRDPELFVRWTQAAVFSSHMRFHGVGDRAPWSYGGKAEEAVLDALRWRYRLLPYLWKALEEANRTGLPVQRAMPIACPHDRAAWSFEEQFFFGPDILVAPVLEPGGRVRYYLPAGDWLHLESDEVRTGGRVYTETLELGDVAVFVRKGAVLPLGPAVQHIGELGADKITEPVIEEMRRYG